MNLTPTPSEITCRRDEREGRQLRELRARCTSIRADLEYAFDGSSNLHGVRITTRDGETITGVNVDPCAVIDYAADRLARSDWDQDR